MRIIFCVIFACISLSAFTQTLYETDDARYREVADQAIRKIVGSDFQKSFEFVSAYDYYYTDGKDAALVLMSGEEARSSARQNGIQVLYRFRNADGMYFGVRYTDRHGYRRISSGYRVYLNSAFQLLEPLDKSLLKKVHSQYKTKLISESRAQSIAGEPAGIAEPVDGRNNKLFYDVKSGRFIWRIIAGSGSRNDGAMQEFEIDARSGKVLSRQTYSADD